MTPVALALVLALPAATGGRWGVTLSSDVQGGLISVAPGQPTRPTMSTTVSPQFSLSLLSTGYTLRASYGLRVFRRFEFDPADPDTPLPNNQLPIQPLDRFLLLHTFGASASTRLAAGWSLSSNTNITLGEVDVPSAAGFLQNNTGAAPGTTTPQPTPGQPPPATATDPALAGLPTDDGVIETISIAANGTFSGNLSRDWSLDLGGTLTHSRPISAPDGTSPGLRFIPVQTNLGLTTNLGYRLGAKDTLKLGFTFGYNLSDFGGDYRNLGGSAGWSRRLGQNTNFGLSAGVQHTAVITAPTNLLGRGINAQSAFSPLASITLSSVLMNLRWTRWSGSASAVVSSMRNPVLGNIEPRGGATLQTSITFMPAWSVGVSAILTTPASYGDRPLVGTTGPTGNALAGQFILSETSLQIRVPVSFRVDRGFSISAGGAYQAYAPRFGSKDFAFANPTYTAFAQLTVSIDQAM